MHEHRAVGPVLRMAAEAERESALRRARPKEDALDAATDANAPRRLE